MTYISYFILSSKYIKKKDFLYWKLSGQKSGLWCFRGENIEMYLYIMFYCSRGEQNILFVWGTQAFSQPPSLQFNKKNKVTNMSVKSLHAYDMYITNCIKSLYVNVKKCMYIFWNTAYSNFEFQKIIFWNSFL